MRCACGGCGCKRGDARIAQASAPCHPLRLCDGWVRGWSFQSVGVSRGLRSPFSSRVWPVLRQCFTHGSRHDASRDCWRPRSRQAGAGAERVVTMAVNHEPAWQSTRSGLESAGFPAIAGGFLLDMEQGTRTLAALPFAFLALHRPLQLFGHGACRHGVGAHGP